MYKKFIPCIYLYKGNAVRGFNDNTILDTNPAALAKFYSDNNADELIVYDLSEGDTEHEEALDIIKSICTETEIPVIGAGNVHRMEDIKKLIYAGCKKAVLNYSKPENIAITEEVSKKFGKDKIAACIFDVKEITENEALIEEYIEELILVKERFIKEAVAVSKFPMIVSVPEVSLDKILEMLAIHNICGISGYAINENAKELSAIKHLCQTNGILVNTFEAKIPWEEFKLNADGHIPVVVQDYKTDEVLMVAYMNEEAYQMTLKTGRMTYYSRSRSELWIKGETSGHYQYVKSLMADCDKDTILAKVSQIGAACHTGAHSCFFNEIMKREYEESNPLKVFEQVFGVILDRRVHPKEGSYTNYLFDKGLDKILKKLGEEATEIVIAAKNPNANEIKYEIADFLYHMMVLMAEKGVTWEEITEELAKR
ncbi:MAG: bifunctional phosphoribosyl-AMP cyclohydrolase/phosphoribosyl-ATP diphosphatase HisIE [Bacillus sp. (in: Bacteria)]|nr:bifunctional phosphoribosyl-AMP cyclohydrolase/phosphoribosyl-ATP diphosphatase HisIE [Bacillus sp. (in: firmicutes)]MCM1425907.1 bifunctional phosphoribosyl-AMP cyclohydrolase/phosphoribosyl-ATP diphosphatase HisIE [Eubacterium sp.]